MADITYIVNQDDPNNIPGFENYSQADLNLIQQYQINSLFDTNKNFIELYITDLIGNIVERDSNYTSYKLLGTAQSAGKEGASILTIDPIEDSRAYGYENGGIKLLYHFLNDLYTLDKTTTQFYISAISPDRTEVQLQNLNLTNEEIVSFTTTIKDRLATQSYFSEFRLNFSNNDLLIGINIDTLAVEENQTVVVKLYEPLPINYSEKSTLSIVETVSDSVAFEVDTTYQFPEQAPNRLRPANFNLDIADNQVIPTQYLGYNDLFSYPVNNTNNQLYSLVSEKGAELSVNHADYSDFVHFSSAYERLVNFKYKLQLIESYTTSLGLVQNATSQSVGITGSVSYYENLITGVVNNFDHYERYLYYQSSSYAWPKSNSTVPYVNYPSTSSQAVNWYANQLATANGYDLSNGSILIDTIPTYLRDDPNNENYVTFIHMIGQHFDNLWIYAKAVTDKYDGDNRLDFGISKDLVGEALRNFGVKLYTSNKSIENLFASFIGEGYQSGSEVINTYVTGSITGSGLPIVDVSFDDYTKEVQKRIYHNLPFILKTKGTERGVRALVNCFGIPSDTLKIKLYGGRNVDERPFYGDYEYYTSSLDKIRLDNTGSIITGSTLSSYTSIIKRDAKYTDDLHTVEIGFSPTDNIDNLIVSYSLATASLSSFNIDDYIGDPRSLTTNTYGLLNASGSVVTSLEQITNQIMSSSAAYNVQDYVRLIKFFDNVIFKMVRDYVPARSVTDTGIIIKPHLLQRNKAKSPLISGSKPEYSGSIDTAFIESSDGDTFGGLDNYVTSYVDGRQTPQGISQYFGNSSEQPKYNGEFDNSELQVTSGQLTQANIYTDLQLDNYNYGQVQYVSSSDQVCLLNSNQASLGNPYIVNSSTLQLQADDLFNFNQAPTVVYAISTIGNALTGTTPGNPYTSVTLPFNLSSYTNYSEFFISASDPAKAGTCSTQILIRFATCSIALSSYANGLTQVSNQPGNQYNLTAAGANSWIVNLNNQTLQYTASYGGNDYPITNPSNYSFSSIATGTSVTITIKDPLAGNCTLTKTVTVGVCNLGTVPTGSSGLEFDFSTVTIRTGLDLSIEEAPILQDQPIGVVNQFYGMGLQQSQYAKLAFQNRFLDSETTVQYAGQSYPGAGRGIQAFFTQYQSLGATIVFDVYKIMNDPNNTYQSYKDGTDIYDAIRVYEGVQANTTTVSDILGTYSTFTPYFTAYPQNITTPPNIYDSTNPLRPVIVPTPSSTFIGVQQNGVDLYQYLPTTLGEVIERLPVAYQIQATDTAVAACIGTITVYPQQYTQYLAPAAQDGISLPATTLGWSDTGNSDSKYGFVDKVCAVDSGSAIFLGDPQNLQGILTVTVPIRKRYLL
jgi:hypothetical protein